MLSACEKNVTAYSCNSNSYFLTTFVMIINDMHEWKALADHSHHKNNLFSMLSFMAFGSY